MDHRKAFTIIELMMVMGILFLLTGLGINNYQSALTKAKVSRVKTEFRTYTTALEMYAIDHNQFARMAHFNFYGDPAFDLVNDIPVSGVISKSLTTPISYVATSNIIDPFMHNNLNAPLDEQLYTYQNIGEYLKKNPTSKFWPQALSFYGPWRLGSAGPDRTMSHGFANDFQLPYDPTNGSISLGNIWHSPKMSEFSMPPIPQLLGEH